MFGECLPWGRNIQQLSSLQSHSHEARREPRHKVWFERPLHSLCPPLGCRGGGGEKPGLSLAGIHPQDPEYYFRVRGALQRSCNPILSFDTGSFRILGCELLNCSAHQATVKGQSESCPVVSDSATPMDYTVHGVLQARILEWVAFPVSRGSSQPRDRTQVSCITGGFFTNWAIREALQATKT